MSPRNVFWWPENIGMFSVWLSLHPRELPAGDREDQVQCSHCRRANLLSLSLHFRDMTHGPVLACPPGPTESVINQTASPAGLGPADLGANGKAWRPEQQLISKSSWLLQRGLDMLAWSLLETCGCVLEVFSYCEVVIPVV